MHQSAYDDAQRFATQWLHESESLRIVDVGSFDVNGCLRPIFERSRWSYTGADLTAGRNVDLVLSGETSWPELADDSFDVVVSSQVLEHVRRPWLWMRELARICKPQGLVYVCTPNTIGYHPYPIDCWRAWPEGLRAVMEDAGLCIEHVAAQGIDTTGIGRKRPLHEMLPSIPVV